MSTEETANEMSLDKFRAWVAGRKAAGERINIETCEAAWHHGNVLDPYGLRAAMGEKMEGEDWGPTYGRLYFYRSSESDGWVEQGDLPKGLGLEVYARLRERAHAQVDGFIARERPTLSVVRNGEGA
jgi:hypothetical protein